LPGSFNPVAQGVAFQSHVIVSDDLRNSKLTSHATRRASRTSVVLTALFTALLLLQCSLAVYVHTLGIQSSIVKIAVYFDIAGNLIFETEPYYCAFS
jgi:hypothetical protein